MPRYYAAIAPQNPDVVWGIGTSKSAALKDARKCGDEYEGLQATPCTRGLYNHVKARGGADVHMTRTIHGVLTLNKR